MIPRSALLFSGPWNLPQLRQAPYILCCLYTFPIQDCFRHSRGIPMFDFVDRAMPKVVPPVVPGTALIHDSAIL